MALNKEQKEDIKNLLSSKLYAKLNKYVRETTAMPFLAKLMQDSEKVAAYSFIHSLATTLGMSVYEQVSKIVAEPHFDEVRTAFDVEGELTNEENKTISKVIQEIKNKSRKADKEKEIKEILECKRKKEEK